MRKEFLKALSQSDLDAGQKLKVRMVYAIPRFRQSINDFVNDSVEMGAAPQAAGWIDVIMELLPAILEFIELLLKLLDED